MAGDWIKVEHATLDKPEVGRFAELLGVSHGVALEYLLRFWIWMDNNASGKCPGIVRHVSAKGLDELMNCVGFSAALGAVEWLKIDTEKVSISVPNFTTHNGNTAKTRASDAKRKSEKRLENVRKEPDKKGTREEREKREKKVNKEIATPLPADFCISERVRDWAADKGHDQLEERFERFVGYARSSGKRYVDWDAAFQNAVRDNWGDFPTQAPKRELKLAL